jgi:hypothetical protein
LISERLAQHLSTAERPALVAPRPRLSLGHARRAVLERQAAATAVPLPALSDDAAPAVAAVAAAARPGLPALPPRPPPPAAAAAEQAAAAAARSAVEIEVRVVVPDGVSPGAEFDVVFPAPDGSGESRSARVVCPPGASAGWMLTLRVAG